MTCDQRRDSIFLFAAGELEPGELEELRAHLASGCPTCAGVLAEAEATLALMSTALEPVEPSAQTRDALMSRIRDTLLAPPLAAGVQGRDPTITSTSPSETPGHSSRSSPDTSANRPRLRLFTTALLTAAASIAITCAVFFYTTRRQRQFLQSSNLQTVALTSQTQPNARGQVLWDRDHSQWHVTFFNLTPPPPGKEYELWFIPPGGKPMRSKTFTVDENGHESLIVDLPRNIGPIAAAAVTLEKQGGSDTPTMPIQLVGNVPG